MLPASVPSTPGDLVAERIVAKTGTIESMGVVESATGYQTESQLIADMARTGEAVRVRKLSAHEWASDHMTAVEMTAVETNAPKPGYAAKTATAKVSEIRHRQSFGIRRHQSCGNRRRQSRETRHRQSRHHENRPHQSRPRQSL